MGKFKEGSGFKALIFWVVEHPERAKIKIKTNAKIEMTFMNCKIDF